MKNKKINNPKRANIKRYHRPQERKGKMSDLIFKRIVHLLSTGDFDIVLTNRTKNEAGFIDYEDSVIYLNPRIFPVEETLIHEALHILKPELDERSIIEMSSLMFEELNNGKRDKLIAYIKALTSRCIGINKQEIEPSYV